MSDRLFQTAGMFFIVANIYGATDKLPMSYWFYGMTFLCLLLSKKL